MENRFAGAQNQGERRRRRLSHDESTEIGSDSLGFDLPGLEKTLSAPISDSLFRRLVSPRPWKIMFAIFVSTLLTSGIIWSLEHSDTNFTTAGAPADLPARFSGVLLILSSQLAMLIGWIRSESEVDFHGRYRCWKWMAAGLATAGFVQLMGIGHQIPDLMSMMIEPITGRIQAARPAIVFSAGASLSAVLLYRIIPDMGRCSVSQGTLISAVLLLVVRFMLVHGAHTTVDAQTLQALSMLAANAAFAAMLTHCRFVAYINNDPPYVSNPSESEEETLSEPDIAQRDGNQAESESANDDGTQEDQVSTTKDRCEASEAQPPQPAEPPSTNRRKKSKRQKRKAA